MRRWTFALLLFTTAPLRAQELTGPRPDQGIGFSFIIPEGWVASGNSEGYIMGHGTIPGAILLAAKPHTDLDALVQTYSEPTDDGDSHLALSGRPKITGGNTVEVLQTGTMRGTPMTVVAVARLNPYGGNTANLMALAPTESFSDELRSALMAALASVDYTKPATGSASTGGSADKAWHDRLSGARLTYMESYSSPSSVEGGIGGGYSINRRIDLCPQGHYKASSSSDHTMSGSDVSAYGQSGSTGDGQWSAVRQANGNTVLRLTPTSGRVQEYVLSYQDGKTYLDGARWYRTTLASDGPEYAPACP